MYNEIKNLKYWVGGKNKNRPLNLPTQLRTKNLSIQSWKFVLKKSPRVGDNFFELFKFSTLYWIIFWYNYTEPTPTRTDTTVGGLFYFPPWAIHLIQRKTAKTNFKTKGTNRWYYLIISWMKIIILLHKRYFNENYFNKLIPNGSVLLRPMGDNVLSFWIQKCSFICITLGLTCSRIQNWNNSSKVMPWL